jgi:hypothetical protein
MAMVNGYYVPDFGSGTGLVSNSIGSGFGQPIQQPTQPTQYDQYGDPRYADYRKWGQTRDATVNASPEGVAYNKALADLDAFKAATPESGYYSGNFANPELKAQYDKIYGTYNAATQPYFSALQAYEKQNPFTGEQPLGHTMFEAMPATNGTTDSAYEPPNMPMVYDDTAVGTTGGTTGGANTTTLDPSQSTLSPNFSSYIYDMLGRGQGLASLPYQEYTGQRFAGPSALQRQAFQGLSNLQTPGQFQTATNFLTQAGQRAGNMSYGPGTFGNFYQAPQQFQNAQFGNQFTGQASYSPTGFQSQFNAPQAGQATQFQNQFARPVSYQPTTATSGFQAPGAFTPGQFTAGFQAPTTSPATQFQSGFQAPSAYQATDLTAGIGPGSYQAGQFNAGFNYTPQGITTGLGPVGSVQSYMSPYQQGVTDIEKREAARQSAIAAQGERAKFAQAGAFGGARQAIVEAERGRNLAQQMGDIESRGLQGAYDRALAQRAQEAQLGMTAQQATEAGRQFGAERGAQFGLEAQKAGEASRQFGAQYGMQGLGQLLEARKATEQARQFGAGQQMTGAQLQAQYGLSAQQAQEAARQFNAGQQMTSAQLQAQFGLDAQKADEMSRQFAQQQALQTAQVGSQLGLQAQQQTAQERQFGAQQGMQAEQLAAQYGLSAQQAQEAARQFGAGQQMTAAQLQAQFGMDAQKASDLSRQFAAQQQTNIDQLRAQYGLSAQQAAEASRQFGYGQQMNAAQLAAQYGLQGAQQSEASRQFAANYGLQGLQQQIAAAQGLGGLGTQQFGSQLQGLQALLNAGATQQQFAQQPLDFGYQQFQESMKYPYQQATFMQSLLQGLPLQARPYDSGQSGLASALQGGLSGLALYNAFNKP